MGMQFVRNHVRGHALSRLTLMLDRITKKKLFKNEFIQGSCGQKTAKSAAVILIPEEKRGKILDMCS